MLSPVHTTADIDEDNQLPEIVKFYDQIKALR